MYADPAVVNVNAYVLVAAALAVFGSIGFRRGVNRELVTFGAVLFALAASSLLTGALTPFVNKLFRIGHFILSGGLGAENTSAAWNEARALPDAVQSPASQALLKLTVFSLPILVSYLAGMRVKAALSVGQRLLGMLMGGVSGFFIAQHLMPILFPAGETRVALATGPATDLLQNTQVVAVLVVITVVILVAFGLYSSRHVVKK